MGYEIACGDVMPGCPAHFEADSEDALLAQVGEHAGAEHGVTDIPAEVLAQVRAAIRPAGG